MNLLITIIILVLILIFLYFYEKNKRKGNFPNTLNHFDLIHIGKCGGSTVKRQLLLNNVSFNHVHIKKPIYGSKKKYIIIIRNPIKRFISAWNWRKYNICKTQDCNKAQRKVLNRNTLDEFASNLYDNKNNLTFNLNTKIPHINPKGIDFYLNDLLDNVDKKQIIGVITQENLENDYKNTFNINFNEELGSYKKNKAVSDTYLSSKSLNNLKIFLENDYKCIEKLNNMGLLSSKQYKDLTKY